MKMSPYLKNNPSLVPSSREHRCPQCGEAFMGGTLEVTCSTQCSKERQEELRKHRHRIKLARARGEDE